MAKKESTVVGHGSSPGERLWWLDLADSEGFREESLTVEIFRAATRLTRRGAGHEGKVGIE